MGTWAATLHREHGSNNFLNPHPEDYWLSYHSSDGSGTGSDPEVGG